MESNMKMISKNIINAYLKREIDIYKGLLSYMQYTNLPVFIKVPPNFFLKFRTP